MTFLYGYVERTKASIISLREDFQSPDAKIRRWAENRFNELAEHIETLKENLQKNLNERASHIQPELLVEMRKTIDKYAELAADRVVEPELKSDLEKITATPGNREVRTQIQAWAKKNGLDENSFLNKVYDIFFSLTKKAIKEGFIIDDDLQVASLIEEKFGEKFIGDARLNRFVLPALALAVAHSDIDYKAKKAIPVDGMLYNYASLAHYYVAQAADCNPETITEQHIEKNPAAFIQGIRMAKMHQLAGIVIEVPPVSGSGGAAAPREIPIATRIPSDLHGLKNRGNDCWALSMLQFLRHGKGLGREYLAKLPDNNAKEALLDALNFYDAGEISEAIGNTIRNGFKDAGIGNINTENTQHDASEALLGLFSHDIPGELSWHRTRRFYHPNGTGVIIENEEPLTLAPVIPGRVLNAKSDEMNIPSVLRAEDPSDIDTTFTFSRKPDHFTIGLQYENLHQGGICPPSFVLPGSFIEEDSDPIIMDLDAAIIHQGAAPTDGHYIHGGHYISLIRRDGNWYEANDAVVRLITDEEARQLLTPTVFSRPVTVHYVRAHE